jgi:hypothetical protein
MLFVILHFVCNMSKTCVLLFVCNMWVASPMCNMLDWATIWEVLQVMALVLPCRRQSVAEQWAAISFTVCLAGNWLVAWGHANLANKVAVLQFFLRQDGGMLETRPHWYSFSDVFWKALPVIYIGCLITGDCWMGWMGFGRRHPCFSRRSVLGRIVVKLR